MVGRLVLGVAAPLVCFGALLAAAPDLWFWPMALFVLVCVAAYVTSWLRAPRDDDFDAALHGAMFAATAFGALWGIGIGMLTLLILFVALCEPSAGLEFVPFILLGAAAPAGFVAYLRLQRSRWPDRWPRRARSRPRTAAVLSGLLGPGAACLTLFALIDFRATVVERRVVANSPPVEFADLHIWRWIAPGHHWSGITYPREPTADAAERARLDDAFHALTGDWPVSRPDAD